MTRIDIGRTRKLLQEFEWTRLFVEELGWGRPESDKKQAIELDGAAYELREVAQLGAKVFEMVAADGSIPGTRKEWLRCYEEVAKLHHEHLLIFVDRERQQSLWLWGKREGSRLHLRDHLYDKSQPGDLFLSKLAALAVDLSELGPEGQLPVVEVARRLRQALDVERVTKKFYDDYKQEHLDFLQQISGIDDERDRRWYASVLLNRMMFIFFLQKKAFLDGGDVRYLRSRLERSRERGQNLYYQEFLRALFFEGFARPEEERSAATRELLGEVRYLNGGLFLPHRIEQQHPNIAIPDQAFDDLLALFERYSWNLDDSPGGQDDEINPDVLGYIFEKYINQKAFGAYYTRPEITDYLCEQTLYPLILARVNALSTRSFESLQQLLLQLDADLCRTLLHEVLPKLRILDPSCGSGAFLVAALKTLINVYSLVLGRVDFVRDSNLKNWLREARAQHPSLNYFIKKRIITDNLFGVDLMEEATEIARLRLFLALVSSASKVEELEPLPNIDFNIMNGNSLIGLLHVDAHEFDERQRLPMLQLSYSRLVAEKNRLVAVYRDMSTYGDRLRETRDEIERHKAEAKATLDDMLLGEFQKLKIKYEQATWDADQQRGGKPEKRVLRLKDISKLEPFHWGYEFDQALTSGGFDVILTNPPWEAWKPQAKEFFAEHSELVTKKKMRIEDFEKEQARLLEDTEVRRAWLEYQSRFPHVSAYFRLAALYPNRATEVNGRRTSADVNLYKLFLEQCFNLLREGGRCGILLPASIYSDLGATQLRQMLFENTSITALFGLSNEKTIFENVHHAFRFCLLAFSKGGPTKSFAAAFRIEKDEAIKPQQLAAFLHSSNEHVRLTVDLVKRLSPTSLSIMELKTEMDFQVAEKMAMFPLLADTSNATWNLSLASEFHMTNSSHLFSTKPTASSIPLFEGKMIHQYRHDYQLPRYWVDRDSARGKFLGKNSDTGQLFNFEKPRLAFRDVTSNTNERTMIAAILPPGVVCGNTLTVATSLDSAASLLVLSLFNSFTFDFGIRARVTSHCNMFYVYQMPTPRFPGTDPRAKQLIAKSARLTCITAEYAEVWEAALGETWTPESGATDPAERGRLRAEIDGLVAHLYGLTEAEFAHVLSTFPLVPKETKDAALAAYRAFAPKTADPVLAPLLLAGESGRLEFKSTVRWDLKENRKNPDLEKVILKTIAGFLNAQGGTLLIGVADDGSAVGLEYDYALLQKKNRDGFELYLTDLLLRAFAKDLAPSFSLHFHQLQNKDICRLEIAPGPRPVLLQEDKDEVFYLRTLNSTRKLTPSEMIAHTSQRWPK